MKCRRLALVLASAFLVSVATVSPAQAGSFGDGLRLQVTPSCFPEGAPDIMKIQLSHAMPAAVYDFAMTKSLRQISHRSSHVVHLSHGKAGRRGIVFLRTGLPVPVMKGPLGYWTIFAIARNQSGGGDHVGATKRIRVATQGPPSGCAWVNGSGVKHATISAKPRIVYQGSRLTFVLRDFSGQSSKGERDGSG